MSNTMEPERIRISSEDGKYTYVMRGDGSTYALRYGEPWIDSCTCIDGHGMWLSFICELEDARKKMQEKP